MAALYDIASSHWGKGAAVFGHLKAIGVDQGQRILLKTMIDSGMIMEKPSKIPLFCRGEVRMREDITC
jgi:hypothetical protein